jgi:hypothetical protein
MVTAKRRTPVVLECYPAQDYSGPVIPANAFIPFRNPASFNLLRQRQIEGSSPPLKLTAGETLVTGGMAQAADSACRRLTTKDAPGLHGASAPLIPLHCCWGFHGSGCRIHLGSNHPLVRRIRGRHHRLFRTNKAPQIDPACRRPPFSWKWRQHLLWVDLVRAGLPFAGPQRSPETHPVIQGFLALLDFESRLARLRRKMRLGTKCSGFSRISANSRVLVFVLVSPCFRALRPAAGFLT